VNTQRIVTLGAGESRPVASNDSAEGRQQNRRVELKLQPITAG
jgi:outer membrane protein OmpA-like peptidoglycan-associated protein